jgi:hypothetical protein
MVRPADPMRRGLPVSEWPQVDQEAWAKAQTSGDIFDEGGSASHWAEATKRTNAHHYGRWLGYLRWIGQFDEMTAPEPGHAREHPGLQPPSRDHSRPTHAPVDAGGAEGDDAGHGP